MIAASLLFVCRLARFGVGDGAAAVGGSVIASMPDKRALTLSQTSLARSVIAQALLDKGINDGNDTVSLILYILHMYAHARKKAFGSINDILSSRPGIPHEQMPEAMTLRSGPTKRMS